MTGIPILDREPTKIVSGDTLKWKRSFSDYPASTWTLTYELRSKDSGGSITLTATADGDDHSVTVPATTTSGWNAGDYSWDAYMTSGSERKRVDRGIIQVLRNLATAAATFDDRSWVKIILDALEAALQGRASDLQLSYSINNRSIQHMSWEERIAAHNHFKNLYESEKDALELEKGLKTGNKVRTRFVSWP